MTKYDLTVLLKSELKDEAREKLMANVEKTIKALDGVVGKFSELGTKQLAYKLGGVAEAQYIGWTLELPSASVVQLERKLSIDKDVLRHLLVRVDETAKPEVKKKSKK
jgi:small subunit ribosomal protein S6